MASPYGLRVVDNCIACKVEGAACFRDLSTASLKALEAIKYTSTYPAGAVLFVEGQAPRGVFALCQGRVKLSLSSSDGKTLILKIADAGEALGLSATVSGKMYELTAETIEPCQITFFRRENFLRLLRKHSDFCFRVAKQLSDKYTAACREIRTLGLAHSAAEKLANLLLEWSSKNCEPDKPSRFKLHLTHEEIAEMIGTSRETVTRLFAELSRREIAHVKGATLLIRNKTALELIANRQ